MKKIKLQPKFRMISQFVNEKIEKKFPIWIFLVLIGIVTFSYTRITISSDLTLYLNSAINFYNYGATDILPGRPLFPILMSWVFHFLGTDPLNVFWVIRFFAIANPVLVYFLGKKLFNRTIGFFAGIFVLFSYVVNYWSYRHLDAIWPFFVILGIIFMLKQFEKNKIFWLILSAISFSLAFLTKESSIIFALLPFVLILLKRDYRTRLNFKKMIIFILVILICVSPFIFDLAQRTTRLLSAGATSITKDSINSSQDSFLTTVAINPITNYTKGLIKFFYSKNSNSLFTNTNVYIYIGIIVSWLYIFYLAIRRNYSALVLTICFLIYSFVLSFTTEKNMRLGQNIIFFLLSYLALSTFIYKIVFYIQINTKNIKKKTKFIISLISITCFVVVVLLTAYSQVFIKNSKGESNSNFIKGSHFYKKLNNQPNFNFELQGEWEDHTKIAGQWILDNIASDQVFVYFETDGGKRSTSNPLNYYTHYKYKILSAPYKVYENNQIEMKTYIKNPSRPSVIALFYNGLIRVPIAGRLNILVEDDLIDYINELNVDYVIVGLNRNFLNYYLENSPYFEKVFEYTKTGLMHIYKVNSPISAVNKFNPLIDQEVVDLLKLEKEKQSNDEADLRNFFAEQLYFNNLFIDNLISNNYKYIVQKQKGYFKKEGRSYFGTK
jgi:hypothetical protein